MLCYYVNTILLSLLEASVRHRCINKLRIGHFRKQTSSKYENHVLGSYRTL